MKVLTIFKRNKKGGRRGKQKPNKNAEGVTDDEENQPSSSVSPELGEDDEEEDDSRQSDYFSDSSRASPSPTPSSLPSDTPRDFSPSPSPSPNPRPPSPTPSASRSISPSPSPERQVQPSQKATLALLASLAAGVARERRVSFEIPPRNVTPDVYTNYRASTPITAAVPATPPPSALRNPLMGSSPAPSTPTYPPQSQPSSTPIPTEVHPYPQSAPMSPTSVTPPPSHPQQFSSSPTPSHFPYYENTSDSESGDLQNEMISETSSPSPGISDAEPEGEDEEVFEEDELVEELEEDSEMRQSEEEEARREAEAIYRAIRAKRRKGRPLTNAERRMQVIEAREKWLGEQEVLLKSESERLADLNLNLNMEKQAVDRQKRAAKRAEVSARTRVRRAEDILHMKERAIDIVKEGLQDDKRVIQMKRDILMLQKSQMRTGRRSTPYKFPKLLPSRRVNGLVSDDLSFTGSGISSLPWKRSPPPSLIATYAPAASIPRGSGPITPSASPPPRSISKSPSTPVTPVRRASGAQTPNGTPVVTIDLSSFAESSPARQSATPPFYRKHRASYPASPYPNMYSYEHEGEDDFLDVEEPPLSLRLHKDETSYSAYESPTEEEPVSGGEHEEGVPVGEEVMEEPVVEEPVEEEQVEEEPIQPSPPIEPAIPVSAPQMKRSASSNKKKTNLMQQLQLHMSPGQQQRFGITPATPPQQTQPLTRIPTTPPNGSPNESQQSLPSTASPSSLPSTPTTPASPTRRPSPPGKRPELEDSPKKRMDRPPDRKPPPPPHTPNHNEVIPAITVSPSPIPGSPARLQNAPSAGSLAKQPQSPYQPPFQPNPYHQSPFPPHPSHPHSPHPPQPPHHHAQPPHSHPSQPPYSPQPPFQPNPYHQSPQPPFQQPQFHPYPPHAGYPPHMFQQPQHQQVPPQQQHPYPPHYQQIQQPSPHYQAQRSLSPPKQQPTATNTTTLPNGPLKQTKQNSNSNVPSSPIGIPQPSPKASNQSPVPTTSPSNKRSLSPQKQVTAPSISPTPSPITTAHFSSTPSSPSSPKKHLALHAQELQNPGSPPVQLLPESSLLSEPLSTDSENISVISLTNDKWKAGFLMRREGAGMAVTWPRKYIVMTKTGLLYYFRSAVDFTTSGYTDLNNYTHIKIPEDPKNRHNYPKFTFQLVSKSKRSSSPPKSSSSPPSSPTPSLSAPKLLLSADSRKEMNAWIYAINLFWQNEAEKNTVKKQIIPPTLTSSSSSSSPSSSAVAPPTPIPTIVRTPSPPVKVTPPPEVKPKSESEVPHPVDHMHKKRASKGKKIVS